MDQGSGFRVQGPGFKVQDLGLRIYCSRLRSEFRCKVYGYRVKGLV